MPINWTTYRHEDRRKVYQVDKCGRLYDIFRFIIERTDSENIKPGLYCKIRMSSSAEYLHMEVISPVITVKSTTVLYRHFQHMKAHRLPI